MDLERKDLTEAPFSSAALVIDNDITDKSKGKTVAITIYSTGGNIVVFFKNGYTPEQVLTYGEKFIGETLRANRFKVFKAEVQNNGE